MRLFGILLIMLVVGFGEYVFVEVMPFPPEQRMHRLEQIPGIRHGIYAWERYEIEQWIKEESPYAWVAMLELGRKHHDQPMIDQAMAHLRMSDTHLARLYLYTYDRADEEKMDSALLQAHVLAAGLEAIPHPGRSVEEQREISRVVSERFEGVKTEAAKGDSLSRAVLRHLSRLQAAG